MNTRPVAPAASPPGHRSTWWLSTTNSKNSNRSIAPITNSAMADGPVTSTVGRVTRSSVTVQSGRNISSKAAPSPRVTASA